MYHLLRKSNYLPTVRAAQDLAGLLKQSCPEVRSMVDALQEIVTRSHAKLDAISGQLEEAERVNEREGRDSRHNLLPMPDADEVKNALNDLAAAYGALLALKHHKNRLRYTTR